MWIHSDIHIPAQANAPELSFGAGGTFIKHAILLIGGFVEFGCPGLAVYSRQRR